MTQAVGSGQWAVGSGQWAAIEVAGPWVPLVAPGQCRVGHIDTLVEYDRCYLIVSPTAHCPLPTAHSPRNHAMTRPDLGPGRAARAASIWTASQAKEATATTNAQAFMSFFNRVS